MYKTYSKLAIKVFLILTPILLILAMLPNIIFDKCSVFKILQARITKNFNSFKTTDNYVNTKYFVTNYVLTNKNKYNALVVGSSRVGFIPANKIKEYKFFGLSYACGIPKQHYDHLKFLIDHKVKLKLILIGLDDFSFTKDPEDFYHISEQSNPASWYPFPTNFRENVDFYLKYLFLFDFDKKKKDTSPIFDGFSVLTTEQKNRIAKKTNYNKVAWIHPNIIRYKSFDEIKMIKDLCDKNNIEVIFFMNPLHKTTYMYNNFENLLIIKSRLVKITPYWDFAYLNKFTTNNNYWYETSHFKEDLGLLMLKKMGFLKDKNRPCQSSFGVYVDQNNIQEHIQMLKENRKSGK